MAHLHAHAAVLHHWLTSAFAVCIYSISRLSDEIVVTKVKAD